MNITGFRSILAVAALVTVGTTHAGTNGYTDYASLMGENATWSLWDVFPQNGTVYGFPKAANFAALEDTSGTSGAVMNGSFSAGNPGALLLADAAGTTNSMLYTGGTTAAFTIYALALDNVTTFALQIKQDGSNPSDPGNPDVSGLTAEFAPTINGVAYTNYSVSTAFADVEGGAVGFTVTTWTWSGLAIEEGDLLAVSFQNSGNHLSLDGVRIDADGQLAVPEPSTYALLALGLGGVLWMMRRRSTARSAA